MRTKILTASFAAVLLVAPSAARAQSPTDGCWLQGGSLAEAAERPSPLDSTVVTLGGERAKVCYGAPSARGRDVMGDLVPWEQPWRLGANEATALYLPFAAEFGSLRLAPGVYSLYAVPGQELWTIVVNGTPQRWGIPISAEVQASDVGRFEVTPTATDDHVERLTLTFEPRGESAADLLVSWEGTRLSIPLRRVDG